MIHQCDDLDLVRNIADVIETSTASIHKPVYDSLIRFYEEHNKFPDFGYVVKNFPEISFGAKYTGEYSSDIILEFSSNLRKEVFRGLAQECLLQDDFSGAGKHCENAFNLKKKLIQYKPEDAIREYDEMKGRDSGVFSGIPQIDNVVNSFAYGTVTVIGAPPGSFKTTLAQNIAYFSLHKNLKVCFITLELTKKNITNNMISRHSAYMGNPIIAEHIHKCMLESYGERETYEIVNKNYIDSGLSLNFFPISAEDIASWEKGYLLKMLEESEKAMGGLDVVILDYIQLCRSFTPEKVRDSAEFVNTIITNFSLITKSYNGRGLITFLLSQVNRDGMKNIEKTDGDKGMVISSLAEFHALEREAHVIILLYASETDKRSRLLRVKVVKNRTGPTHSESETALMDPTTGVIGKNTFSEVMNINNLVETFSSGDLDDLDGEF